MERYSCMNRYIALFIGSLKVTGVAHSAGFLRYYPS